MNTVEFVVTIVILIVVIYYFSGYGSTSSAPANTKRYRCYSKDGPEVVDYEITRKSVDNKGIGDVVSEAAKKESMLNRDPLERRQMARERFNDILANMINENKDYFDSAAPSACTGEKGMDCSGESRYVEDAYGLPGASFNEYIAASGVNNEIVLSHQRFVDERRAFNAESGHFEVGRSFHPILMAQEGIETDYLDWRYKRPVAVQGMQDAAKQQSDVPDEWFTRGTIKYCYNS